MIYLFVGIAGIVGALLRYNLGMVVDFWWLGLFPLGTFLANLIGCFALGCFTARFSRVKTIHPYVITAVGTGLIGSFTTFSTFSVETVNLVRESHIFIAFIYVFLSLIGGLFLSWLGYKVGQFYFARREKVSAL